VASLLILSISSTPFPLISVEFRDEHRAGLPNAFVRLERATEE
jgi:hypothetical protein